MSTLISSATVNNQPIKCTLTRIMDDFHSNDFHSQRDMTIVKNYVYSPEKRLIA